MANALVAFPCLSDVNPLFTPAPVLVGGSWQASLPLANLQDRRIHKVARSVDATTGSTQFDIDFGTARSIRVLALVGVNFTSAATVEVDAGTTQGATGVRDGAALAAYPAGETPETLDGLTLSYVLVLPAALSARWWRVKIVDTSNPAGYVEIGRLFAGPAYQPTINARYGLRQGFEDDSAAHNTDGGATILTERRVRRTVQFVLPQIPVNEALANLFPLAHRQRTTRQCYFVFDPDDTTHLFRRSFLCRQRELSASEMATFDRYEHPLSLVEEL